MINVSNEWKSIVADCAEDNTIPNFTAKAIITLSDSTVLDISAADIVTGGMSIKDSVSENDKFQIGTAFINENDLLLNNIEHKFDTYDFTNAVVIPYVGLVKSSATEWIKKGVFTVDEPTTSASIISLISLDNMNKFDKPFSEVNVSFPTTALSLLQAVCTHCGVVLSTTTFLNANFTINTRLGDEAITCRDIIGYIAQLSGSFARCNTDGALELKWYNMEVLDNLNNINAGTFTNPSADTVNAGTFKTPSSDIISAGTFTELEEYHHIYSFGAQPVIGTDDVVITGIQIKAKGNTSDYGETVLFGSTGYVISIEDNPLIQENTAATIANSIGAKIVGMSFRTASVQTITDPSREAGDVAVLSYKDNIYSIIMSNYSYTFGTNDKITSDAETPSKNSSTRYSVTTKTIVESRKVVKQELSTYDLMVQQFSTLISGAMGMFRTQVPTDNGGAIEYIHDQPTLAESTVRWSIVSGNMVEENQANGVWTPASGTDKQGNALYNVLTARGINVNWLIGNLITGKNIISPSGTYGKIEFMNGVLNLVNTLANRVMKIGLVSSTSQFGPTPYIGLDANIDSFGIGTSSDNFSHYSSIYQYTPADNKHHIFGDVDITGNVNIGGSISNGGGASGLIIDSRGFTFTVTNGQITDIQGP